RRQVQAQLCSSQRRLPLQSSSVALPRPSRKRGGTCYRFIRCFYGTQRNHLNLGLSILRLLKLRVKKTPAKARVLAVRESTISGRLQLPVYLHLWWKSNIIMPDHLALQRRALRRRRGSAASAGARHSGTKHLATAEHDLGPVLVDPGAKPVGGSLR